MPRSAQIAAVVAALAALGYGPLAAPAQEMPTHWAVTGVAADDVLHLRDVPSADSRSLARIPHNARGLKHLGCRRNQLPLEQWARMSDNARREALTQWCRVQYRDQQGWVAGRFLRPDAGAGR
jgi:hypothetical protein